MAVTRSSNKQSHIEDFPRTKSNPAKGRDTKSTSSTSPKSTKRKAPSSEDTKQSPPKKSKPTKSKPPQSRQQQHLSPSDTAKLEKPIIINRSPVLHLWGACVAHTQHPDLSWAACLNIGSAISTLCAVSKGKAIGMIEPKDKSPDEKAKKEEKKEKAKQGASQVEVMGFDLPMKGDGVVLSGKEINVKEGGLIGKFGGQETYESVKKVMESALEGWKGKEEELGGKAFHMYEKFRPTVPKGEQGWGRKGELNLAEVKNVAKG